MRRKLISQQPGADLLQVLPIRDNWSPPPSAKFVYNIMWIQKAGECSTKHLFVLRPGIKLDIEQLRHSTGYQISFREEALLMLGCEHFMPFCKQTYTSPVSHIEITNQQLFADMDGVITKMSRITCQGNSPQMGLLYGLLKVFLVYVARHYNNGNQPSEICDENGLYDKFIDLLNQGQSEKKAVNDYAYALSVSTNTLNGAIRKISGYTASHHIQQRIILKAKQAAITSQASMKEVAFGLGFQDIAHFSKYFRHNAGMTFSDFKRTFQIS